MSTPIARPVGPTLRPAMNTSNPPPAPRSSTTSPGWSAASAFGLPHERPSQTRHLSLPSPDDGLKAGRRAFPKGFHAGFIHTVTRFAQLPPKRAALLLWGPPLT